MRLSAGNLANAAAWLVVVALIGGATVVADRFGFVGLILLGGITWLVCTKASLDREVPTASVAVFSAAMERQRSPEGKAAAEADRLATMSPLRFYGRCGAFLTVVGALGFAWQFWHNRHP